MTRAALPALRGSAPARTSSTSIPIPGRSRKLRGVTVEIAREGGAHATPAGSRSSRVKRDVAVSGRGNARRSNSS